MSSKKRCSLTDTLKQASNLNTEKLTSAAQTLNKIQKKDKNSKKTMEDNSKINSRTNTMLNNKTDDMINTKLNGMPNTIPLKHSNTKIKNLLLKDKKCMLTEKQKKIYDFLLENPKVITSYNNMVKILGISRNTIRAILTKFEKMGIIKKQKYSQMGVQGLYIELVNLIENIGMPNNMSK